MCNLSERTQNKMFQRPELCVAMKKKKVSLFHGKTLDAERLLSLSSNKETRTEEGDREILCGKDDRAVLNRQKKRFSATIFFREGESGFNTLNIF